MELFWTFDQMSEVKSSIHSAAKALRGTLARHPVDDLDVKILRALLLHGRLSAREIATSLHVSTSTVTARMERLRDRQILRAFTAVVDFQKLGYDLTVVTEIHVSKGKLLEMEREIAKLPGVCAVYDVTGEIDAVVISKCRNREELSHFTKGLLAMHFVERTNSHVVLMTVKEDFRLPI
ncbi:MAG TPA: Lrp/AsnC family transcriptional regulator [Nitrososphaerales archaeon]|nr:Lrp/AsnC family transcriptional regulator [Nitrososphaerales archaeon]